MSETPLFDRLGRRGAEFLGVRRPILCGGMTWISDVKLVRAVQDCGGFGVLAGGNMPPDLLERELDRCDSELERPFALNLITIAPNFEAHKRIAIRRKVPFVVFAGNFPRQRDVRQVKDAGIRALSFASTMSIAEQQVRFGVDALILEGSESGGHIGHVALSVLLQQVLFHDPPVPVFVAGGIGTGRMIAHLLLMGAAGCQMGTRFVVSEECNAHPNFKQRFIAARAREAVATPTFDRRLPVVAVRAIRNAAMDDFSALQLRLIEDLNARRIPREEAQRQVEEFWVGGLRRAVVDGDLQQGSIMAGQSVGLVHRIQPMREIFRELVDDAEAELRRARAALG
jgi:enoyl-[acyl-carrier protein] reductase II